MEPSAASSGERLRGVPPAAAVAQLPWPRWDLPENAPWEAFARFPNFWEGHIVGGLLRSEGIPVTIEFLWPGLDLTSRSVVWIPSELVHRARWLLSWPAPSEEELTFLATGKLPADIRHEDAGGGWCGPPGDGAP